MDFANDIGKWSADQSQAVTFLMQTAWICQSQYWLHICGEQLDKIRKYKWNVQTEKEMQIIK